MKSKRTLVIDGEASSINLRLPATLHKRIKERAKRESKSISLVIVECLEKGFSGAEPALCHRGSENSNPDQPLGEKSG